MKDLQSFIDSLSHVQLIHSIIIVIVSVVLYRVIVYFINKTEKRDKLFTSKKSKTYLKLMRSIIRYVFILVTILIVLQANGVNVNSVLAGVGILGAVFGLAIQDLLKDIIRGSSILSDNYFSVGDIVLISDPRKERYFLHRVWEIKDGQVLTWGDNCVGPDGWIPSEYIWGKVTSIERNGRKIRTDAKKGMHWARLWHHAGGSYRFLKRIKGGIARRVF